MAQYYEGQILTKDEWVDFANWTNGHPEEMLTGEALEDGTFKIVSYAPTPEEIQKRKESAKRAQRNQMLITEVDPMQLIFRNEELSEADQANYREYRQYLLNFTEQEGWVEMDIMTFEEWKQQH